MNRWYFAIATLALVIFEAACSSAPPPAPDTRAADEKAIQAVEAAWLQDIVSKDLEKSISHYTDDASFLLADMPIQTGKDAIRATYKQMLAGPQHGGRIFFLQGRSRKERGFRLFPGRLHHDRNRPQD